MRTTINLDDDALEIARQYSEGHSIALGKAISDLVRRGAHAPTPTRLVNGFVVFDLPAGGTKTKITSKRVKELLESDVDDIVSAGR